MKKILNQHTPFVLLIIMVGFWSWYYLGNHALNNYGKTQPEWLLLLDGVIFLPLVCLYFFRDNIKLGVAKAFIYMCVMIMLGSWIIPDEQKKAWLVLEQLRYVVLAVFVFFEFMAIATLLISIRSSLKDRADPDLSINKSIGAIFGNNFAAKVLEFESRVWTYALFAQRIDPKAYVGESHYYSDLKDGVRSYLQGFIYIIIFEMPLLHMFLHFTVSATTAWIITGLSMLGLVYMIAEYRAFKLRPVSLTSNTAQRRGIIIRYSVWNNRFIPYDSILSVEQNKVSVKRGSTVKLYNLVGVPNIKISLDKKSFSDEWEICKPTAVDKEDNAVVYLGLNQPQAFIQELQNRLNTLNIH